MGDREEEETGQDFGRDGGSWEHGAPWVWDEGRGWPVEKQRPLTQRLSHVASAAASRDLSFLQRQNSQLVSVSTERLLYAVTR